MTSWRTRQPEGETGLVERLHEFAETTRGRALVVIISDLFVNPPELREAFDHLRFRKHDVSVFPFDGPAGDFVSTFADRRVLLISKVVFPYSQIPARSWIVINKQWLTI